MKRILATTLILFTTASLFAQGTENLDTAVVSSSQIPQTVRESGRNITIITAKDIQAIPATSLDEILQTVTGLEVQSRGGFGVQGDILMRGATFTQVLVLIDGMKMNDPLTGHFNSYIPVSPAEIERIEILRGAAAAMYGADAVGGVINVITRTFSDRTYPNGAIITGNFNRGNHQLTSTQQGFHYTNGRTMIGAGILMNQSEGESFPARILDTSTTLSAYNNHFDVRTLGASFSHRFQRGYSIHIRSSYDFRDFGARYFYTTSPFDKSEETVSNYWNQLRVAKQWKQGVTDLNISHKYNTDEFVFSPDFPSTNNHISRYTNLIVNHLYSINSQLKLKLGVQADQRSIESNDRGTHDDFHTGLYGMTHYRTDDWSVSVSARADYDNNYGLEFTPQVNAARIYDKWVIRASAGRVIRAADYTERYVSNNLLNLTPGRSLGNPDLVAESGWSEELGFNFQPNTQWMFKGTAFARQSANLIDYALTNQRVIGSVSETGSLVDSADYYFARNITDVTTTGFEFESALRTRLTHSVNLKWTVGYTYLNTTNAEDVVSVYISSHARHLVTSSLQVQRGRYSLVLTGLYKERMGQVASGIVTELNPAYLLMNAKLSAQITDELLLNLQCQNILNTMYQNILGAQMPGRWMLGGIGWRIR